MMEKIDPSFKTKLNENEDFNSKTQESKLKQRTINGVEFLIKGITLRITKHRNSTDNKLFTQLYTEFMDILEKYFQHVDDNITDISADSESLSAYIPQRELDALSPEDINSLFNDLQIFLRRLDEPQIKNLRTTKKG